MKRLSESWRVQQLVARTIRSRRRFADIKADGTYLNLGCGPNVAPGFCNMDYAWHPGIDICWDATDPFPFPDDYVGGAFTEHMLEHLVMEEALFVLSELRRVLKPGAVLRIVIPDGGLYLREYAKFSAGEDYSMPLAKMDYDTYPIVTPIVAVNRVIRNHGHLFIWDFPTLRIALDRTGFDQIELRSFREGRDAKLLLDHDNRLPESMYVEAVA